MKAQKKLSILLIILLIILISIISFVGIFYQDKNQMVNIIPDYTLGTDLSGYRKIVLTVDESDEGNTEDILKYDNYVKSANVIKARLKSMKIEDYTVRCDEATGQIEITIPENDQTEYILADITQKGVFEIRNTANNEVLMDNNDIRNVEVNVDRSSYDISSSAIYMDINFNNNGSRKFRDITRDYQNIITNETTTENTVNETASNEVNETTGENVNETTADDSTNEANTNTLNETSNEIAEETTEEDNTTEIGLYIDGTSMMTTSFSQIIDNGVMSLSLGSSSSADQTKILTYQAESLSAILENDAMPIQYSVTGNIYISSPIEQNTINILIGISICIEIIMLIALIIKYRVKGVIASFCSVGFIALYLLILRYTNVVITLEGMFAIALVFVINYIFNIMILNRLQNNMEKTFTKAITKFSLSMVPMLILAVVCCFSSWMSLFSFGMIVFWGLVVSVIYNLLITRAFLKCVGNSSKEKNSNKKDKTKKDTKSK